MNKALKILLIIIFSIILIFAIYICEESIRLSKVQTAKPLIITDQTKYCVECINVGEEIEMEYYSIGYKVKIRYYKSEKSHGDLAFIGILGKEFYLFNRYLIWGWIV